MVSPYTRKPCMKCFFKEVNSATPEYIYKIKQEMRDENLNRNLNKNVK